MLLSLSDAVAYSRTCSSPSHSQPPHRREVHRAALYILSPATRAGLDASFMAHPAFRLVSCLRATPGQGRYQPAGSCQVSRPGSSRSASLGPQLPLG